MPSIAEFFGKLKKIGTIFQFQYDKSTKMVGRITVKDCSGTVIILDHPIIALVPVPYDEENASVIPNGMGTDYGFVRRDLLLPYQEFLAPGSMCVELLNGLNGWIPDTYFRLLIGVCCLISAEDRNDIESVRRIGSELRELGEFLFKRDGERISKHLYNMTRSGYTKYFLDKLNIDKIFSGETSIERERFSSEFCSAIGFYPNAIWLDEFHDEKEVKIELERRFYELNVKHVRIHAKGQDRISIAQLAVARFCAAHQDIRPEYRHNSVTS
jgi:hypothetical protein